MECEIYKDLLITLIGISALCAMVVVVYVVYKKNQ
jgi:hypothetical protein